ncbi:MAG: hypothetical protein ACKO1N_04270 [Erythrobacter sp.]
MHILEILKRTSPEERREIGEIFLSFADGPLSPRQTAEIDLVLAKFRDPKENDIVEQFKQSQERMHRYHEGFARTGTDHRTLLAAELERRGDGRTVQQFLDAECNGLEQSNVGSLWVDEPS